MTNIYTTRFQQRLEALHTYATRCGTSDVPVAHIEHTPNGPIELGRWVSHIRMQYRKGLLPAERQAPLEKIPGWNWTPRPPGPKPATTRNAQIKALREQGASLDVIAEEFGISKQRVHQLLKRGY